MGGYELRQRIRAGEFNGQTSGQCPGYQQANVVILPASSADDFLRYCVSNPKPCPILAVGEPGQAKLTQLGHDVDIRRDIPAYRVFRHGEAVASCDNIMDLWQSDFVAFVLGCSFSFEAALQRAGITIGHIAAQRNVPMYITQIPTQAAGSFSGPLVVSMRAFNPAQAIRAIVLSERYPHAHGAPVHIGDPTAIGIADIHQPDFGDPPVLQDGDIAVFWACGVTPQLALRQAAPALAITHQPGHMLITDLPTDGTIT